MAVLRLRPVMNLFATQKHPLSAYYVPGIKMNQSPPFKEAIYQKVGRIALIKNYKRF